MNTAPRNHSVVHAGSVWKTAVGPGGVKGPGFKGKRLGNPHGTVESTKSP